MEEQKKPEQNPIAPGRNLTPQEQQRFIEYYNDKTKHGGGICVVCGSKEWNINSGLVQITPFYGKGPNILGGPCYPMVMIACHSCKHLEFFSALQIGFLDPETATDDPNAKQS